MVIINTTEDFVRAMDENPDWLEAVRSRVLTRELMELPARFAEYARANDARMSALERIVAENREILVSHGKLLASHSETLASHSELLKGIIRRLDGFEPDIGRLRGWHASEVVRRQSALVALAVGCREVGTLSIEDLLALEDTADTSGIAANDLHSFRRADLVMKATRRDTGETLYIAVEISYTVNGRDTRRAIRNADFLKRFTGADALAVVAGVRKDNRVDEDIASNRVFWYELDIHDLEAN